MRPLLPPDLAEGAAEAYERRADWRAACIGTARAARRGVARRRDENDMARVVRVEG